MKGIAGVLSSDFSLGSSIMKTSDPYFGNTGISGKRTLPKGNENDPFNGGTLPEVTKYPDQPESSFPWWIVVAGLFVYYLNK